MIYSSPKILFTYSISLPTLQIITTNYRDEYIKRDENIAKYARNLITNSDIQNLRTIEGDFSDYILDKDKIKELKSLINMYF